MTAASTDASVSAPEPQQSLRLREDDPDYTRLHAATLKRLQASVAELVRDLRAAARGHGTVPQAQSAFIARHTALLRGCYLQAHAVGQRHYWTQMSAQPHKWQRATATAAAPSTRQVQQRLLFYAAGSVAKLASQAAQAQHAGQAALVSQAQPATGSATLPTVLYERERGLVLNYPDRGNHGYWHSNGGGSATAEAPRPSAASFGARVAGVVGLLRHGGGRTAVAGHMPEALGRGAHVEWGAEEGQARATFRRLFGRDLADHEVAALVGARPGDRVEIGYVTARSVTLDLRGAHDAYEASRSIQTAYDEKTGNHPIGVGIGNSSFHVMPGYSGHGIGTEVFAREVAAAHALGVVNIKTRAEGQGHGVDEHGTPRVIPNRGDMNGYYTWARLGYDTSLQTSDFTSYGYRDRMPAWVQRANTMHDLMRIPATHGPDGHESGADWWKANGKGWFATFDLRPGSRSIQVLREYLIEKGQHIDGVALAEAFEQGGDEIEWAPADDAAADRVWQRLDVLWRTEDESRHFAEANSRRSSPASSPVSSPVCRWCWWWKPGDGHACAAYPRAGSLPEPIWNGDNRHLTRYEGDHGILFVLNPKMAAEAPAWARQALTASSPDAKRMLRTEQRLKADGAYTAAEPEADDRRIFIGGHLPGYQQNRGPGGKFAPGDGGEHAGEGEGGSGGGGGGAGRASSGGGGGRGGASKGSSGRTSRVKTEAGNTRIVRAASGHASARATKAEQEAEQKTRAAASKGKAIAEGTSGEKGPLARGGAKGGGTPKEQAYQRKATTIQAERVTEEGGRTVHTLEGDQHANKGDWVVTGVKGEQYSMPHESFTARYEAAKSGAAGQYTRIQEQVSAHQATAKEVGSTITTNSGRELHVSKGDMIVRQADGDHAVVKPDIFKATYEKAGATGGKAAAEDVHAHAAQLRAEQGLPKETTWASVEKDSMGNAVVPIRATDANRQASPEASAGERAKLLAQDYGEENLAVKLQSYSTPMLQQAARDLGVPPSSSRAETISRVTRAVTNGRYSAEDQVRAAAADKAARTTATTAKAEPAGNKAAPRERAAKAQATAESQLKARVMSQQELDAWDGRRPGESQHDVTGKNQYAPHNPYAIHALYGEGQMTAALGRYSMPALREMGRVATARIKDMGQGDVTIGGRGKSDLIASIAKAVSEHPSQPFWSGDYAAH